ncbi:hypothetical protein AL013_10895 [Mariprofundus ferrooxydans]|nr:hypothetical protein AL013_10895 [Mariprofundus ferrooxydans]
MRKVVQWVAMVGGAAGILLTDPQPAIIFRVIETVFGRFHYRIDIILADHINHGGGILVG